MPEQTEKDERQALLDKLQCEIDRLDELQRVASHLRAGGSYDEPWVREFFDREKAED